MSFHPHMEYAPARFHASARSLPDEGGEFTYTPENQAKFDANVSRYPADQRQSAILYALYLAQRQQGYLTGAAMRHVARQIGCTAAEVEDVVSYYTMFFTKPVGKYVVHVCRTLSCALLGAERMTEALCDALGIRPGETDPTGTFTLLEVECLGACDRAPVVMVNDDWHERLAPEQAVAFLQQLHARGPASLTGCHLHREGDREQGTRDREQGTGDRGQGEGGRG